MLPQPTSFFNIQPWELRHPKFLECLVIPTMLPNDCLLSLRLWHLGCVKDMSSPALFSHVVIFIRSFGTHSHTPRHEASDYQTDRTIQSNLAYAGVDGFRCPSAQEWYVRAARDARCLMPFAHMPLPPFDFLFQLTAILPLPPPHTHTAILRTGTIMPSPPVRTRPAPAA